jgi:hypothetical protein
VDIGVAAMRLGELVHQAMRKNIPKTVAAMTGGEYEVFKSHNGFESRMSEFTNHLYGRYMLSFVPKDAGPGLHQLRVRLKGPANATVIARMNYWAVGKPESDSQP